MATTWRGVRSRRIVEAAGSSSSDRTGLFITTSTPSRSASATSAAAIWPLPRRANGHPTAWASIPSTSPKDAVSGRSRETIECAARPANSARAPGSRKAIRARRLAGSRAGNPNRASAIGCRGGRTTGPRSVGSSRSTSSTNGANSRRQAPPSRPSPAAVSSIDRSTTTARSGASMWATGAGGWTHVTPPRSRSRDLKNGDATPSGCAVEHGSWMNPGSVSSAERAPPPAVAAAS